jgi:hypothetical protein
MSTAEYELVAELPSYHTHLASSSVRKKHFTRLDLGLPSIKHGG